MKDLVSKGPIGSFVVRGCVIASAAKQSLKDNCIKVVVETRFIASLSVGCSLTIE